MKKNSFITHLQIIFLMAITLICHQNLNAQTKIEISLIEFTVNKNGSNLVGLKNPKGDIVLPANYSFIRWVGDYALVGHPTAISGTGLINKQGKLLIDPSLYCDIELYNINSDVVLFVNGFAKILICDDKLGNLYGFIDTNGKEIIPPKYKRVGEFINGSVEVKSVDNLVFRIDSKGKKL